MKHGMQAVYRLETYRFVEKYSRFMRSNPQTFPEFYPDQYGDGVWVPPRFAATWKPQKLVGDVWPENDYPGEGAPAYLTPVFSPRAVEGLREFLEPNGELLPVLTKLGTYYAYNVTTVVDALDQQEADVDWSVGSTSRASEVRRFAFRNGIVDQLTVFKIPQMPVEIYVTEPFTRRVKQLGLTGMWITKCWPMPEGVSWLDAWREALDVMRSGENGEVSRNGAILPVTRKEAVQAPLILDLRKDVDAIEGLIREVMVWIGSRQADWATKGEFVSAIGLETGGWDMDAGPEVMCHVDTRESHEPDGHWSHFNVATLILPHWSAMASAIDDGSVRRTLIDAEGKEHGVRGAGDRVFRWFCEAMVAATKQAKLRGVYKQLLHPEKCSLAVEDTDSGFGWPRYEDRGKEDRAS